MKMCSSLLNSYYEAKTWIAKLFNGGGETMRVHFNIGVANQTFNFHGYVPEEYLNDDKLYAGFLQLMAIAEINPGWEDDAKCASGDVDLFAFALERIAAIAAKSKARAVTRKRGNKT